jgi:hypothetical protein
MERSGLGRKIIPGKNDYLDLNYDFSGEVTIVYPMLHVKTQSDVPLHQKSQDIGPWSTNFHILGLRKHNFMLIKLSNPYYYIELNYDRCRSIKWTKIPFFTPWLDRCPMGPWIHSYYLCPPWKLSLTYTPFSHLWGLNLSQYKEGMNQQVRYSWFVAQNAHLAHSNSPLQSWVWALLSYAFS